MSNKNKTQEELNQQTKLREHRETNKKNPDKFKKLRRRRHGIGKHRK